MKKPGFRGRCEFIRQRLGLLGCDVEPENLDRDKAVPRRFVSSEHRAERTDADLMQHPEGAECWRGGERVLIVSGQGAKAPQGGVYEM